MDPPLLERLTSDAQSLARTVGDTASHLGSRAYLVGGPVRDLMLGRQVVDLDFAVEGEAIPLAKALARRLDGQAKAHGRFGTATVLLPDGGSLDLATTRAESYPRPGALPEVRPAALGEDLRRRDFTLNAMALAVNPEEWGQLSDPHGGAGDLQASVLRVLHGQSFRDDPTRLIRGVRLEERLGFRFNAETEALANKAVRSGTFDALTPERLRDALFLMLEEPVAARASLRLAELGFWEWFLPGLAPDETTLNRLSETLRSGDSWGGGEVRRPLLWLSAILFAVGAGEAARAGARRVRLSPRDAADLRSMVAALALLPEWQAEPPAASALVETLRGLPPETPLLFAAAAEEGALRERLEWYAREGRHVRLAIDGSDLLALGYRAGPAIGAALRATLRARLDGQIGGRAAELEFARAWLAEEEGKRQA